MLQYIHKLNSGNLLLTCLFVFLFFFFFVTDNKYSLHKRSKIQIIQIFNYYLIECLLYVNILESRSNKRRQNLGVGSVRIQLKTARTRPCFWLCQHPLPDNGRPRGIVWHACVHCVYGYYFMVILTNRCNTCVYHGHYIHVQYDVGCGHTAVYFWFEISDLFFFYHLCFWELSFILRIDKSIFHLISFFRAFFGYFILSSIIHLYFIIILYYI